MNILKKIYCRIFQFCFKVSIPLLPYYNPVILKKFDDIPAVLKEKKISRLLLVTDRGVRKIGLTQKLETLLSENGIEVTVFDGVVSNPTVENVEDAKDLYLTNNCQALIGFGGGSAIDCAKATGACIANPKRSIIDMAGILKVFKKIPLLFAIPTTAGTGTETTVATLITDSLTKRKYMISDFPLIPKYAVLDPETTRTLPKSITAYSGVDVLVHAVEAYIGNSTTPKTRHQALEATRLVFENLKNAYEDGNDFVVEVVNVPTTKQLSINCKGKDIEIAAERIINEDIDSILSDLMIKTSLKENIAAIIFDNIFPRLDLVSIDFIIMIF